MTPNLGIYLPDVNTEVGRFRVLLGDVSADPLNPPDPVYASYKMFSDIELQGFLVSAEMSLDGAMYFAYMQMAGAAARESKNVKDLDLQVDLTKRATDLRLIAQMWLDRWNTATADIFEVFDIGGSDCGCAPELAPGSVCRRGCNGSGLF